MLIHLHLWYLLFFGFIFDLAPIEKGEVVKHKEEFIIDAEELEKDYNQLSNEQKLRLLFLVDENLNDSLDFLQLTKQSIIDTQSVIKKASFSTSTKLSSFLGDWIYDHHSAKIIETNFLSAISPEDSALISENPLVRSKIVNQINLELLYKGKTLLFKNLNRTITERNLNKTDAFSLVYSSISFLDHPEAVILNLNDFPATKQVTDSVREMLKFKGFLHYEFYDESITLDEIAQKFKAGFDLISTSQAISNQFIETYSISENFKSLKVEKRCKNALRLLKILKLGEGKNQVKYDGAQLDYLLIQKSLTCVKNQDNFLPINNLLQKIQLIPFSTSSSVYLSGINYADLVDEYRNVQVFDGYSEKLEILIEKAKKSQAEHKILLASALELYRNRTKDLDVFGQILSTPLSDVFSQKILVQALFGAYSVDGKIPYYLKPTLQSEVAPSWNSLNRLKYAEPKHLGLSDDILKAADSIADKAISAGAFPGCQILFAWKGTVVYQKSFGFVDIQKNKKVDNQMIYDLASISKIAGSTVGLMKLDGEGKFSLDQKLGNYLPNENLPQSFQNISLKDMMAHQAGLPAWIPFYTSTLKNGVPDEKFYRKTKNEDYSIEVAKDLYLLKSYPDSIFKKILSQKLNGKEYVYSDLGYYFVKKIIEQKTEKSFEYFLRSQIYSKLGLRTMRYNPLNHFSIDQIVPTENDQSFRKQLIRGYVHDPGAAMLGGVGGHAGLFANANDLAILMQMLLNNGEYGGEQILNKEVVQKFTSVQFPNSNRRGAGFDKPTFSKKGGTACEEVSSSSYGHSGFTGTLTWADPEYNINYVFLSNRVHPSADNWKIVKMNVRTDIQSVWYKAVKSSQFKDYSTLL